jgi:hypothetical protein
MQAIIRETLVLYDGSPKPAGHWKNWIDGLGGPSYEPEYQE